MFCKANPLPCVKKPPLSPSKTPDFTLPQPPSPSTSLPRQNQTGKTLRPPHPADSGKLLPPFAGRSARPPSPAGKGARREKARSPACAGLLKTLYAVGRSPTCFPFEWLPTAPDSTELYRRRRIPRRLGLTAKPARDELFKVPLPSDLRPFFPFEWATCPDGGQALSDRSPPPTRSGSSTGSVPGPSRCTRSWKSRKYSRNRASRPSEHGAHRPPLPRRSRSAKARS